MRYRIKIHGQTWSYAVLSVEEYVRQHGSEGSSVAITDPETRRIDFMPEKASFMTIVHELVHAYKSYLCLEDADNIDDAAYEEIYATFFSKNILTILGSAVKIYSNLNGTDLSMSEAVQIEDLLILLKKLEKNLQ